MKKIFAIVMSVLMIACFMPSMAFAAGVANCTTENCGHEAAIGTTHYATLAEAIGAVKDGDTITLLKDVTITKESYSVNKRLNVEKNNVTIDLNKKKLTASNCALTIVANNVTVENGCMVATPSPTQTSGTYGSYTMQVKGKNVTIKKITMTGGINVCGSNSADTEKPDATVTVTDCNITATNYYAVCAQRNSAVSIESSTLKGGTEAFFWAEKVGYSEGGSAAANVSARVSYNAKMVKFEGNNALYNTGGVAPVVTGLDIGNGKAIEADAVTTEADLNAAFAAGKNVMLASDITADVTVPEGKTVVLYLNEKKLTNKSNHTITNAGTLTIAGTGTIDNITDGRAALYNKGTATLNGGTFTRSNETGENKDTGGANSWYTIKNVGTMTINRGVTVENKGHFSSMIANGYYSSKEYGDGITHPTLTINGGTFTGGINTIKNDDKAVLYINGGTSTNTTQAALQNHGTAYVTGGTFDASTNNYYSVDNCGCVEEVDPGKLTISGGEFKGIVNIRSQYSDVKISGGTFTGSISKANENSGKLAITGGTFSTDPKEYCGESLLFTAHAGISKTSTDGTLKDVTDSSPATWKLTVKDTTKSIAAGIATYSSADDAEENAGKTVSVPVTVKGANIDQVSVVITGGADDWTSANIKYYGTLAGINPSTTVQQTGTFVLPSSLPTDYKVYLLAEDLSAENSSANVDYASEPVEIKPVAAKVTNKQDQSGDTVKETVTTDAQTNTTTTVTEKKKGNTTTTTEKVEKTTDGITTTTETEVEVTTDENKTTAVETKTVTDNTGKVTKSEITSSEVVKDTANKKTTTTETKTVVDNDTKTTTRTETKVVAEAEKITTEETTATTKDGVTTVATTKNVEDITNNVAAKTTTAEGVATTTAKIADEGSTIPAEVKIDATAAKSVTGTSVAVPEVKKADVTLPAATVATLEAVAKESAGTAKVETVELTTDVATLTIDNKALQTLTENTGESTETDKSLVLTVEKTNSTVGKVANATATYELTAKLGGEDVFKKDGAEANGTITISVPYKRASNSKTLKVFYVDESGARHDMDAEYDGNTGMLIWNTNHFSTYEVEETVSSGGRGGYVAPTTDDTEKDNTTTDTETDEQIQAENAAKAASLTKALSLKARSVKTAKGNIKVTLTVDNDAIKAIEDLGYTVKYKFYRSTKKAKGYKATVEKAGKTYTNTTGKKGTKYYYKARVMVYDAQDEVIAKSALSQCKYACRTK